MFPFPGPMGPMGPMPPFGAPMGMPMGPLPVSGPFGTHTEALGKVRYKYCTPDGGPPLDGAPPDTMSQPGAGPFPPPFPPPPYGAPPCPFGLPPGAPPPWCAMPQPQPSPSPWEPPRPPTPPGHAFSSSNQPPQPPVEGNRVKGQLATFPNNSAGYIFPRHNITFHMFNQNVLHKYRDRMVNNSFTIDNNDTWTAEHAPCSMTIEELILQLDCVKRANHHPPYNQPGRGYPEAEIGIQELIDCGGGRYMLGSKFTLTDNVRFSRIGDIWPAWTGDAGQVKPPYIVRMPV